MEKQWKAIEPGVWRPTPEKPSIEGVLVNTEPKNEQANFSARYYLENQEGMFLVWGCAILDDRMRYVKNRPGGQNHLQGPDPQPEGAKGEFV